MIDLNRYIRRDQATAIVREVFFVVEDLIIEEIREASSKQDNDTLAKLARDLKNMKAVREKLNKLIRETEVAV